MPAHVYRRGSSYWWRRTIPRVLKTFGDFEIRRTLRAQILQKATAKAHRLDVALDEVFEAMLAFADEVQMLPGEAVHRIAREICDAAVDEAARTLALVPMRAVAEAAAAARLGTTRVQVLWAALARNDYRPVASQVVEALVRHGIPVAKECPDFRLASRAAPRQLFPSTNTKRLPSA